VVSTDTTPPVITLTGTTVNVEAATPYIEPGFSAFDDFDGDLTASVTDNSASIDTDISGTYTITYVVSDMAANLATTSRTIIVADTTPPNIGLLNGTITHEAGTSYIDPGYFATDSVDGSLTFSVTNNLSDVLMLGVPGTYVATFGVTDAAGNFASTSRTIIVVDTTPPTITLVGGTLTFFANQPFVDPGVTAFDQVDGLITPNSNTNIVNTSVPGTYTIIYTAQDNAGNMSTAMRTVFVVDGDPDGDGLPSSWETANGLNPNSSLGNDGALNDNDGDGFTNLEEYQADTNPNDGTDYLRIVNTEQLTGGHVIDFPAKGTRKYSLERLTDLPGSQIWLSVNGLINVPGAPGTNGMMSVTDPAPICPVSFYRIRVSP